MSNNESLKDVKNGVAIIGEVIKAAGDNPNVKAAGSELGRTALTLTKTINNALLPLAAVNYAFEKAHEYFKNRFQKDLEQKAATLPPDKIVEPKASIAGPALQGLAFSHEEPSLKDMYLSLLTSAMDGRITEKAHPAFVDIIRQLNSEEAKHLSEGLRVPDGIPIVEIRLQFPGSGWIPLLSHLVNMRNDKGEPVKNQMFPAMVDNWIRLGLVVVDYSKHLTDDKNYSWISARPEFLRFHSTRENEKDKVIFQKGVMFRTAWGEQFASIVGIFA